MNKNGCGEKSKPWALPKPTCFLKKARPKTLLKPHIHAVFWVEDETSVWLKKFMLRTYFFNGEITILHFLHKYDST
ncbi:MAG: hypothetical protein AB7E42_04070 [Anaerotignaceae bacterium]